MMVDNKYERMRYGSLQHKRKLLLRAILQNLVGLPPFAVFLYFLVAGLIDNPDWATGHPGFWGLFALAVSWYLLFTNKGLLLAYGILKFDYATQVGKKLSDCFEDLKELLEKLAVSYSSTRLIGARLIRTSYGSILLVGLDRLRSGFAIGYTAVFYSRYFLDAIETYYFSVPSAAL